MPMMTRRGSDMIGLDPRGKAFQSVGETLGVLDRGDMCRVKNYPLGLRRYGLHLTGPFEGGGLVMRSRDDQRRPRPSGKRLGGAARLERGAGGGIAFGRHGR